MKSGIDTFINVTFDCLLDTSGDLNDRNETTTSSSIRNPSHSLSRPPAYFGLVMVAARLIQYHSAESGNKPYPKRFTERLTTRAALTPTSPPAIDLTSPNSTHPPPTWPEPHPHHLLRRSDSGTRTSCRPEGTHWEVHSRILEPVCLFAAYVGVTVAERVHSELEDAAAAAAAAVSAATACTSKTFRPLRSPKSWTA